MRFSLDSDLPTCLVPSRRTHNSRKSDSHQPVTPARLVLRSHVALVDRTSQGGDLVTLCVCLCGLGLGLGSREGPLHLLYCWFLSGSSTHSGLPSSSTGLLGPDTHCSLAWSHRCLSLCSLASFWIWLLWLPWGCLAWTCSPGLPPTLAHAVFSAGWMSVVPLLYLMLLTLFSTFSAQVPTHHPQGRFWPLLWAPTVSRTFFWNGFCSTLYLSAV